MNGRHENMRSLTNNHNVRLIGLAALGLLTFAGHALGQQYRMPQDNWQFDGLRIDGNFGTIAIGPDDNIYVATNNSAISVFSPDGTFLRPFESNMNVAGIAFDAETNIFILDLASSTNYVKKFNSQGEQLAAFGPYGSETNQLIPEVGETRIAVGLGGRVYVADRGNRRIQVFDNLGNHLFHWGGSSGGLEGIGGRFYEIDGLVALPNGDICVRNSFLGAYHPSQRSYELQLFSPEGTFLKVKRASSVARVIASRAIAATPDGLVWSWQAKQDVTGSDASRDGIALFHVYSGDNTVENFAIAYNLAVRGAPYSIDPAERVIAAFDRMGRMYVSTRGRGILRAARHYAGETSLAPSFVPLPTVLRTEQRPNTSLVEIDYRVLDADDSLVSTAILVFVENGNDLSSLRIPTAFVENTSTNAGSGIPVNTVRRVTWDASELVTNFVNLQFEVLANDGRGLLPLSFVTIPAAGTNASLTMSRSSVTDQDLISVWYWLLGTNSSSITLTNGVVRGVGGAYDGQTLASGVNTTQPGRQFLYGLLGIRASDPVEIARAQGGSYGFFSIDGNNVVKLP